MNAPNALGQTPMHRAASLGHLEIVKCLVSANSMTPNFLGRTPIHCAASYGHLEIMKILVGLTEDPNLPYQDNIFGDIIFKF